MDEYVVPPGMALSVFDNKYSRRKLDGTMQTWAERVREVVAGNFLMDPRLDIERSSGQPYGAFEYRQARAELARTTDLAVAGIMPFSGRHLQHGDDTQPERLLELFSNCSTALFSFQSFRLLLRGCFRAGTLIKMADGSYKPIEELVPGDSVVSFDAERNEFTSSSVAEVHENAPKRMVRVVLDDGESIVCTEDHVFILADGTECVASELAGKDVKHSIK